MIFASFILHQNTFGQTWQDAVLDSAYKILPSDSVYVKNEVIIKFKPNALDLSKLCYSYSNDNLSQKGKKVESSLGLSYDLQHFLDEQRFSVDDLVLDNSLRLRMKSYGGDSLRRITHANSCKDTLSISRNGDTVPMAHYLYMVLILNNDTSVVPACVWLSTFHQSQIDYAHVNGRVGLQTSTPNDKHYGRQGFLTQSYIGADFAWDTEVGDPATLVGVFEQFLIDHRHCDLGNGKWGDNEKIVYKRAKRMNLIDDHSTSVAGIIAAHTNREGCYNFADSSQGGVAGIAGGWGDLGGDADLGTGASLLSYAFDFDEAYLAGNILSASSNSLATGYGEVIDIGNFSIISDVPRSQSLILEEAYNFMQSNDVAKVASRGNTGLNRYQIPGSFAHHKCTSVGGSMKLSGNLIKSWTSSYGREMDVLAPAPSCSINDTIICTTKPVNIAGTDTISNWGCFDGTSAAAPQVSGSYALIHALAKDSNWTVYPEDYEGMIKASAKDIIGTDYSTNYDENSGWGQLDLKQLFFMIRNGYKLYHFEVTDEMDTTLGEFTDTFHSILVSNPTDDSNLVRAGHWNVKIRPITCKVQHPTQWVDNGSHKIYVWGRKGAEKSKFGWPPSKEPESQLYWFSGTEVLFQNGYTGVISGYGGNTSTESMMIHDNTLPTNSHEFEFITYQYKFDSVLTTFEVPSLEKIGFHYTVFAKLLPDNPSNVEITDDISIRLFPTPTTSYVTIQSDNFLFEKVKLEIFNNIGELLHIENSIISNRLQIDITNYPSGVYFVTISNGLSRITKKFIKSK